MISVIFIGASAFSLPTLETLANDAGFRLLGVITQSAKPMGRKQDMAETPVAKKAKELNLPVWSPEKIGEMADELLALRPDCLVVASYGQIIPEKILAIPRLGAFNVHPSLLPKYRGASPVPAALLANELETGVTIMLMDAKMDHGPILAQEKINIEPTMTAPALLEELARQGARLLVETIVKFAAGDCLAKPQNDSAATFCRLFTREDGRIDFKKTAIEIFNQYRALTPWPGVYAKMSTGKKIKFLSVASGGSRLMEAPGTLFSRGKELCLATIDGTLNILELQLEGGKPLTAMAFINGYGQKLPFNLK